MRALGLHRQGRKRRDIAAALGASKGAVSPWLAAARCAGPEAPASLTDRRGVTPRLGPEQVRLIPDLLWHGAEAYGFRGDVWTCGRVAGVIREEFDVSYSKGQVSRLLKRPGWAPQVPITRAIRRDEEASARRRAESWPALKKRARRERRELVLVDESGFYLLPGVVKSDAPRARTPVLDEWQTRDHLSVMGGVTPRGKVDSLVRPRSLSGLHTTESLLHLGRSAGDRLLVIRDGSPIHRRAEVTELVAEARGAACVERLPAYAPDPNPVEWMWRPLKEVELRNLSCLALDQLHLEFHLTLGRLRQKPRLVPSFFEGAGLPI